MKKPRATYKNFPDFPKEKAQKIARVANRIVDLLWPLSPKMRQKVLDKALNHPEVEGV